MAGGGLSADVSRMVAKSIFDKYDQDGSGLLDTAETSMLLGDYGLGEEESALLQAVIDADGTGKLSFDEFWAWMQTSGRMEVVDTGSTKYAAMTAATASFMEADTSGDGVVTKAELKQMALRWGMTPADADAMVAYIDPDETETVGLAGFLRYLAATSEQWRAQLSITTRPG